MMETRPRQQRWHVTATEADPLRATSLQRLDTCWDTPPGMARV
ncbi:hypothetical protein J2W77_001758 [Methylorubrum extorquens]|nr:hypothetical protein [Methylorubrum extorquens]MCP1578816.1 hypothetical protein [Methylorubrum extorquens]